MEKTNIYGKYISAEETEIPCCMLYLNKFANIFVKSFYANKLTHGIIN